MKYLKALIFSLVFLFIFNCGGDSHPPTTCKSDADCPTGKVCYKKACVDISEADNDGDGVSAKDGDCDDSNPLMYPEAIEDCDGLDNDCNGVVDEGCECVNGETRPCSKNMGICKEGTQKCENGNWSDCIGGVEPLPIDDCGDMLDNDCDGSVDELCACSNEGEQRPCGTPIGTCTEGVQTCTNGQWTECQNAVFPQEEICDDNLDNDCDGSIDEGCTCTTGQTKDCGMDVGACSKGTQECVDGKWSLCEGGTLPEPELCDGLDNDCDGEVDEDFVILNTGCSVGVGECKRDGFYICSPDGEGVICNVEPGEPHEEICDGKDNDCDGQIDEDQDGNPMTVHCYDGPDGTEGVGPCVGGEKQCINGTWTTCDGEVLPQPELCDGLDNNCDGQVDEIFLNLGQPCSVGLGECERQGVYICEPVTQRTTICDANPGTPQNEVCDGKDNDCDGQVDEELTRSCSYGCGEGAEVCYQGQWVGCTAPQPSQEVCDGIDNDCDGQIDEDFTLGGSCSVGVGSCKSVGFIICDPNDPTRTVCNAVAGQPAAEACDDGVDNDCDGQVDEDCGGCARYSNYLPTALGGFIFMLIFRIKKNKKEEQEDA